MAQGISLISGSPLIGSPIVFQVTPATYASNRTFHRIIVRVYAMLESDENYTTFDFSTPVETKSVNSSFITVPSLFDISSALQAVADKYEYEAIPPQRYPYIKFRVQAWDEWMANGVDVPNQGIVAWPGASSDAYAFMGAWTDLERMNASVQNGAESLSTSIMSRKPNSSPEVVFINADFIYPDGFERSIFNLDSAPSNGPRSLTYTPQADGAATIGGHDIYAVQRPEDMGYLLRFVNGFSCLESLCVTSLKKRSVAIHTDKHVVARQETLKKFSRSVVRKSNDRETWALTSGPLDEEWASWYIHEFLMSEQIWIQSGTLWIPCHVVPEDTTILEDQEKAQPLEVQFRLEMDINGSPL